MNKMFQRSLVSILGLSILLTFALGSGSSRRVVHTPVIQYVPVEVKTGYLQRGVTIAAEDGSFTLNGGQTFSTPFSAFIWNGSYYSKLFSTNLTSRFSTALQLGAKKVRVNVNGRDLYGVLLFSKVNQYAYGPGARSYLIKIPQGRVKEARHGNISVVYEKVKWQRGHYYKGQYYSWILWLSATPF